MWSQADFFFRAPEEYDKEVVKKRWKEDTPIMMQELNLVLKGISDFSAIVTEEIVKKWIDEKRI